MDKIGLILAQHNEVAYIPQCLQNWISYREHNPLLIACLDVCFQENGEGNSTDGSLQLLRQYKHDNKIDYVEVLPPGLKEHEARNVALKWLLENNCQIIISIGADEVFKLLDIKAIFDYVEKEKFISVFKIQYKNYVLSRWQYVLGFNPHRIWRVNYNGWKLKEFYNDDDTLYEKDGQIITDKQLPSKIIPNVLTDHYTWCDFSRAKSKVEYQEKHFSHGAGCSFRINNNKIEFNPEYYKKTGQSIPEVYEDITYHTGPYGKFVIEPLDSIGRAIKEDEFWDKWMKDYLDQLTLNDICIDIGASIGFHTIYMARKAKWVYSFEPQLINYDRIVKNLYLNNIHNVTAHNVALYNRECKMGVKGKASQKEISYGTREYEAASLSLSENPNADIIAKTLDSFGLENISLIKCDAEDQDLKVLEGGIKTIEKSRPLIIYEDGDRCKETPPFLVPLKYKIKEIATSNFLAYLPEHKERFKLEEILKEKL